MNNLLLEYSQQLPLFIIVSFIGSLISTLIGFGGGIILVVLLSGTIPTKELIAVVGLVQLASLLSRCYLTRQQINLRLWRHFMLGAVPGILIAALLFNHISNATLSLILGAFLIFSAWKPQGLPVDRIPAGVPLLGGMMSFVSFFVGAPGPSIASMLQRLKLARQPLLATLAACLLGQTLFRTLTFYSVGVPLQQWLPICALMIIAGVVGSLVGYRLSNRISDRPLLIAVRLAMAGAGLNLLINA
ncbi:sulfite exporter TauE/SafE family protein [Motiliproteus coralliicola]|uniref:Probable membrane transporter protein n=1 Tax=Motiliproteus coralliicola TaxID=2283196 RepID=A0A369WSJ7_9GAMM|nr:sulfite exporter TauE/SafE family protein [Motiliproteus coralliicola]RDE24647.1 sulfite exporter TauE/SafE family protein [Motiliproteus coralliicola]